MPMTHDYAASNIAPSLYQEASPGHLLDEVDVGMAGQSVSVELNLGARRARPAPRQQQ